MSKETTSRSEANSVSRRQLSRRAFLLGIGGCILLYEILGCDNQERAPIEAGTLPFYKGVVAPPDVQNHYTSMKEAGVQAVRHQGVRLSQFLSPKAKPDLHIGQWRELEKNGFVPIIQIYSQPSPKWANTGIFHNRKAGHEAYAAGTLTEPMKHIARTIPHKYFKVGNEYDRDLRPAWMDHYARMMKESYEAIKSVRPDAVVIVEGGFTTEIVKEFIKREVYKYTDIIDHHLYGDDWQDDSRQWSFHKKVEMAREAGFEGPIFSTEFGIPAGNGAAGHEGDASDWRILDKGGTRDYTQQEIAARFEQKAKDFYAKGGDTLFYFPYSTWGEAGKINSRFHEAHMVDKNNIPRPVYDIFESLEKAS